MSRSRFVTFLATGVLGTALMTGVGAAEPPAEGVSTPPEPPRSAAPPRHHRGPIDLATANERAAKAFDAADTNADGQITAEEFDGAALHGRAMHRRASGQHKHHARTSGDDPAVREAERASRQAELFASLDKDGNGQLSSEEFSGMDAVRKEMRKRAAFARIDANDDGVLTKDEYPPFVARLNGLDTDGDGQVTRDEMRKARGQKSPDAS